jgi:hypothetical protein
MLPDVAAHVVLSVDLLVADAASLALLLLVDRFQVATKVLLKRKRCRAHGAWGLARHTATLDTFLLAVDRDNMFAACVLTMERNGPVSTYRREALFLKSFPHVSQATVPVCECPASHLVLFIQDVRYCPPVPCAPPERA